MAYSTHNESLLRSGDRIFVTGHQGMVGSAVCRQLEIAGYANVLQVSRAKLDLRDQAASDAWFAEYRPDVVVATAGTVGGIMANSERSAEFLYDNLMIGANTVASSHRHGVRRLLNLGSSCIYPRSADQPIRESSLLTGVLEPTNEGYAVAKIATLKLCEHYRAQYGMDAFSLMPTNLYGPGDNFDLRDSHVIPALMLRLHEAKVSGSESVTIWGTGTPRREFLHVEDLAKACVCTLESYAGDEGFVNVGCGEDLSIRRLATLLRDVVGGKFDLVFDHSKPDGMPRRLLDVSKILKLGWRPTIDLDQGLRETYRWFQESL